MRPYYSRRNKVKLRAVIGVTLLAIIVFAGSATAFTDSQIERDIKAKFFPDYKTPSSKIVKTPGYIDGGSQIDSSK